MKRYFCLFGSFFLLIFLASCAFAQDEIPHGQWSVAVLGGINYSISSSMHGTIDDYQAAIRNGTTASQYPFGTIHAHSLPGELEFEYRFAKSPISLFLSGTGSMFNSGRVFGYSQNGRYSLSIATATTGIEYTFGQTYQHWNFFGRFGINSNIISGSYRSGGNRFQDTMFNSTSQRYGIEIVVGERYHFSRWPIGIEAALGYSNVNLTGKDYAAPILESGFRFGPPATSSINDGKNPSDPADSPRVIDYLSLHIGARFYF